MKKVISLFLSLTMLLSIVSVIDFSAFADTLTTGNCGDNVTYSFDESTGVLTISGTGDMNQWPEDDSPWCADTRIKTLIIDEGVTSIGDRAFQDCRNLSNVKLPNSLTLIYNDAFSNCTSLASVIIPDSVTSIGDDAFLGCISLKSIEISDNNKNYSSVDGVLFNKNKSVLVIYPAGKTDSVYSIPNSVTSIGNSAFSGCDNLKNIYYKGSQEEWNKINIRDNNNNLTNATIYYNFIACTQNNHNYFGDWTVVKEATCTTTGLKQRTCSYDGYTETIVIPATGHNFGNNSANCLVCGTANPNYVASTPTPSPAPTPAPTLTPTPTQPTQTSKPVAKPKSAKIKKVKPAKKAVSVEWKKVSGVKGYQVQVATDKKFKKNKKTATVKKQKTTKVTIKKLKAKKKYYVRIRTYKTVKGKKIYSSWSKVKTVKTK